MFSERIYMRICRVGNMLRFSGRAGELVTNVANGQKYVPNSIQFDLVIKR